MAIGKAEVPEGYDPDFDNFMYDEDGKLKPLKKRRAARGLQKKSDQLVLSFANVFGEDANPANFEPEDIEDFTPEKATLAQVKDMRAEALKEQELEPPKTLAETSVLEMAKAKERKPYKTQLTIKYENEEAAAYERLNKAIAYARSLYSNEVKEYLGRTDLTEEEEKKKHRELIRYAKSVVKAVEPENRFHIFLFKSATGSWWKIGGNSVAFYSLMIGSYLDRSVNINQDRDNFSIFKEGVICLQNAERIEKDIFYSGAKMTEDLSVDFGPFKNAIKAYRLNVPFPKHEVKRFKNLEPENIKKINNNVYAAAPDVEIHRLITQTLFDCYHLERQVDSNSSRILGHPVLDAVRKLRRAYYDVANAEMKSERRHLAMLRVDEAVGDVMTVLSDYAELGIANRNAIVQTSMKLAKVRELARNRINKYEKRHEVKDKLEAAQEEDGGA